MHKVWLWLHSDTVEKWSDDMKLRLNHAVATICCLVFGSGIAQADTFDLDCVILEKQIAVRSDGKLFIGPF